MSRVITSSGLDSIHGKVDGRTRGYFYQSKVTGRIFYRERDENYQQNQSERQKWNSAAFKYAHQQLRALLASPESKAQLESEYESSKHIASNGKSYTTLRAWKFNSLLHDWKQEHPFE